MVFYSNFYKGSYFFIKVHIKFLKIRQLVKNGDGCCDCAVNRKYMPDLVCKLKKYT